MFASNLFRDEAELRQFLADVEQDLREGRSQDAAERVDFALGVLEEFGHPIAAMCRAYPVSAIQVHGWDKLAARLEGLDRPDSPITAIGIDLSAHGGAHADSDDAVAPYLETNFYSDGAFPFSTADRNSLCAGYDSSSTDWQGNFEDIDGTIEISGIGRLNFAIDALESVTDDPVVADARVFATTYRAVAVHHAVRMMIETHGLPRALTVLVGSNESYPFFDAPVITGDEYLEKFAEQAVSVPVDAPVEWADEDDVAEASDHYASLDEPIEAEDNWAADIDVPEDHNPDAAPSEPVDIAPPVIDQIANGAHISGSEIRRRFADPSVVVQQKSKSGLLGRLFGR